MHAWLLETRDPHPEPVLRDVPLRAPGPSDLRLRVSVCSVNFADLLMLKGSYQATPPLPFAPGGEVCGVVEAVGESIDPGWIGRRVAAYCGHGGFAECVTVPLSACVAVPDVLGDAEAAALPVAHGSAEIALARRARLKGGEWLLVSGAGGGVGLTGVEIGALLGARVIGLARGTEKQAAARTAGAEIVIDPEEFDLTGRDLPNRIRDLTDGHGADVIYDPVGGALGKAMERAAAFEARLLPIGFASGEVPSYKANHLLVKNVDVIGFWWGAYFEHAPQAMAESLARLMRWAADGAIRPAIAERVPFAQAPRALDLLRERKVAGKTVVDSYPAKAART